MAEPTSYLPTDFFGWRQNEGYLIPAASTLDFLLACERAVSSERAGGCIVSDTGGCIGPTVELMLLLIKVDG